MAKQSKKKPGVRKKTETVASKSISVIKPDLPLSPEALIPDQPTYWPYLITAIFFGLSLLGILKHEMWRDEYQAWMVAADAHSIPQLFQNLKYEGNPVLWHAFLFVITMFTDNPFGMQIFHILISAGFIFLINRYAPFNLLQKILLTFGYYTFYEYNIISRGYGLGLLLIVTFCILYAQRQRHILWIAAVLFLLANSTIFGVMLAVCFSGIILLEQLFLSKKSKALKIPLSRLALAMGIAGLGVILGYLQIRPEPDNSFPALYVTHYDPVRTQYAFSRLIHAYFAIPNFRDLHFWNENFLVPDERKYLMGITPFIYLLWILSFLRYRLILVLYTGGSLLLIVFFYYTGFIWSRYAGHLFLLLLACCWLVYYAKEKPYKANLINKFTLLTDKLRQPLFYAVLIVSLIGGVLAYIKDLQFPFSTSEQAAKFIKDNKLDQYEIIGSVDYIVSPLATLLDKKILYAERKEHGSFIIYDQKRTNIWSFAEVQATIEQMHKDGEKQVILVKSIPIMQTFNTGESVLWEAATLTPQLFMTRLATISSGIVEDEKYYIYSIKDSIPSTQ